MNEAMRECLVRAVQERAERTPEDSLKTKVGRWIDTAQIHKGARGFKPETLWRALELATEREESRDLINRIMARSSLCPFGGGLDGERNACRFGHPGCACDDWIEEHRGAIDELTTEK